MNLELAEQYSNDFIRMMKDNCYLTQIEVAGSVRRERSEVKDIEIIVKPMIKYKALDIDRGIPGLTRRGILRPRPTPSGRKPPYGKKYYRIDHKGAPIDLFVVLPPADYGII